jgi:hypothetical protein
LRFTGKGDEFGFLDRNFIPISRFESIFHHPRELGYYTCLIGSHIPFGSFLGNSVDFCHSASHGPKFGYGFFDVFLYHLYGAAVRFPHDLAISKIGVIQGYVVNRWTVNLNNSIHERVRTIIQNEHLPAPTYALFHYNIPHPPFIYKREGHAKLFSRYEILSPSKYYGNLAYLDKIIGEIITALKKVGRFESSLIIMTSDHSWRFDPESIGTINQELCHVPLFIKFPYQKESIEIDSKFSTVKLGAIINQYLDGNFNFRKAKSILNAPDYYVAPLKWGGRGFKYTLKNIGQ